MSKYGLRILGSTCDVRYNSKLKKKRFMGRMSQRYDVIEIASDLPAHAEASTLLHEILENLKFKLAIKIKHDDIMRLESGLFQVFMDNGVDLSPLTNKIHP